MSRNAIATPLNARNRHASAPSIAPLASILAIITIALLPATGSARAATFLADARLDYQTTTAGGTTADFNGGTGIADTWGTGRWNYYNDAVGMVDTLLTFGTGAGDQGNAMYRDAASGDQLPAVSDVPIFGLPAPGPDYIQMHAGPDNSHTSALMEWTAGADEATTQLHIQGTVQHGVAIGSVRLDILVNGVHVYSQAMTDTTKQYFNISGLTILPGQKVGFYLYNNGDSNGGDIADMRAHIDAGPIWSEYFNTIFGGPTGVQYQSGRTLQAGASLPDWTNTGGGSVHAVETAPGSADWAPMIWAGDPNVLTLAVPIDANDNGRKYRVDFDVSPAVYQAGVQATLDGDQLLIEVLRGDDSVLASYLSTPGAWAGDLAFHPDWFYYIGDGTGDVRIRISPNGSFQRFAGAIDALAISVVPAPAALPAGVVALGTLAVRRRRR